MKKASPLKITATQRLGKRLDRFESGLLSMTRELEVVKLKLKDLRHEFSQTLHVGNFEAMYRIEREENIKLRLELKQSGVDEELTQKMLGWISELDHLCWKLNPAKLPPMARQDNEAPLTEEECRLVGKFREELKKGMSPDIIGPEQLR